MPRYSLIHDGDRVETIAATITIEVAARELLVRLSQEQPLDYIDTGAAAIILTRWSVWPRAIQTMPSLGPRHHMPDG